MQTKLTVPIAALNLDKARQQIETAQTAGAEMLELRTDYLENLSVELVKNLIAEAKKNDLPIIVTCRDKRQGGAIDYSEQLRIDINSRTFLAAPRKYSGPFCIVIRPKNRTIFSSLSIPLSAKVKSV